MRDECERSGEESTMPAPEKRGEERLLHAASHKREYPPPGNWNPIPAKDSGKKRPMRREGVTVFSRDLSYFWNEVLAHLACASPSENGGL